jgi:hypothetical protein
MPIMSESTDDVLIGQFQSRLLSERRSDAQCRSVRCQRAPSRPVPCNRPRWFMRRIYGCINSSAGEGDRDALRSLMPLLFDELRKVARQQLRRVPSELSSASVLLFASPPRPPSSRGNCLTNTPSDIRQVIQILESRRVKHVLWDDNFRRRSLALIFSSALHLPSDLEPLEAYLRARYTSVDDHNGLQILERRPEPNLP